MLSRSFSRLLSYQPSLSSEHCEDDETSPLTFVRRASAQSGRSEADAENGEQMLSPRRHQSLHGLDRRHEEEENNRSLFSGLRRSLSRMLSYQPLNSDRGENMESMSFNSEVTPSLNDCRLEDKDFIDDALSTPSFRRHASLGHGLNSEKRDVNFLLDLGHCETIKDNDHYKNAPAKTFLEKVRPHKKHFTKSTFIGFLLAMLALVAIVRLTNQAVVYEQLILSNETMTQCQNWSSSDETITPMCRHESIVPNATIFLIQFLESMNLSYTLEGGSLLGSYRHNGLIPGDKDIDIMIPIWENEHLLEKDNEHFCEDARNGLLPYLPDEESHPSALLCGKSEHDWADIFHPIFEQKAKEFSENSAFNFVIRRKDRIWNAHYYIRQFCYTDETKTVSHFEKTIGVNVTRIKPLPCINTDVTFRINDPYTHPICICSWYDVNSKCSARATEQLTELFGPDFMTPDRDLTNSSEFLHTALDLKLLEERNNATTALREEQERLKNPEPEMETEEEEEEEDE